MALFKTSEVKPEDEDDLLHADDDGDDFVICKSPEKLQHLLNAMLPGKAVHYVSKGDWSMHDLVMQLLKSYGPAELYITTYALREFSVRQIILAQAAGDITAVNMVLDYRAKVRTPEVFQLAEMNMNKICLYGIHAKVTVLKSAKGFVTIVGSANWTNNPRVEAGVVSTNKALGEFHIDWIKKLMENAEIFG
jgi:hypothetical protein